MTTLSEELLQMLTNKPQRAEDLKDMMGVDKPSLRTLVHELRCNGYPVCSKTNDGGGYWLGDDQEKAKVLASMKERVKHQVDAIQGMERGPLEGQMEVEIDG